MLPSSKKFLEITNNNPPDVAVILGSGLTNFFDDQDIIESISYEAVSYTHLTLPTKRIV